MPTCEQVLEALLHTPRISLRGRVTKVLGPTVEGSGPRAGVGELCHIEAKGGPVPAEVVGLREGRTILVPLERREEIRPGAVVTADGTALRVPAGPGLVGRVVDALGRPVDGKPLPEGLDRVPVEGSAPAPLERRRIDRPFHTGVSAIDAMATLGVGQRIGVFSASGVGKSTLLGMIARNGQADVNVVGLIGERGREVREFIENDLGPDGMARSVLVVATGDEPAVLRAKAASTATAIAEHFRDQGADVLLMMDSVTRYATALREIGLAAGEPPTTRGYTPSVFASIPRLLERTGQGPKGAITAVYTVLVEGDDHDEPVADTARSVLDGHIVLSRRLTSAGHYPPIDMPESLSRTMPFVVDSEHLRLANRVRELAAAHRDVEDLLAVGAYQPGSKPLADEAIERWPAILRLLRQDRAERRDPAAVRAALEEAAGA